MGKSRTGPPVRRPVHRATLLVAWERVSNNRGAKTAGMDAMTRRAIKDDDVVPFLQELRSKLKDGSFTPLPVRQTTIPKKGGKRRYLGILCRQGVPSKRCLRRHRGRL
jgi:retron-type reverse transcriptase